MRVRLDAGKDWLRMKVKKAAEMKDMSRVVMRKRESSEEATSKIIDFQWQIAQVVERHERQRLLEQIRDMPTSEKQMFLLRIIMTMVRTKLSGNSAVSL